MGGYYDMFSTCNSSATILLGVCRWSVGSLSFNYAFLYSIWKISTQYINVFGLTEGGRGPHFKKNKKHFGVHLIFGQTWTITAYTI